MRFMMLMIPKVYSKAGADADPVPSAELVGKMMMYNEQLSKAGVLIGLDGLQPPAKSTRVHFANGKPTITDGPFTESKEVLGGYWMIRVKSKEEAVEWAAKCPAQDGDIVEIRQVHEIEDFPQDVQEAVRSVDLGI